ncbi:MAG: gamma-glutamylcyclotransferase [Leptolyngbyaceae bacterium]|nr:gamma-glutamylcyclotransferase [Leptolyngbyaceae bacterium]
MVQDSVRVFVYGTLKPGECNYATYCEGRVIKQYEAIAHGSLFDLPMGYPAMAPGHDPVYGVVLCLADATYLSVLDDLEDYVPGRSTHENEYNRELIRVFSPEGKPLGTAWTYVMETEKALAFGGTLLPGGVWTTV